jgi:hypothetical protein
MLLHFLVAGSIFFFVVCVCVIDGLPSVPYIPIRKKHHQNFPAVHGARLLLPSPHLILCDSSLSFQSTFGALDRLERKSSDNEYYHSTGETLSQ